MPSACRPGVEYVYPAEQKKYGYTVVKVFYATDRQLIADAEYIGQRRRILMKEVPAHQSDSASSDQLHEMKQRILQYGVVEVGIPDIHKPGSTESPSSGEEADPLRHIVILSLDTKIRANREEFVEVVKDDLKHKNEVLVFIHGYNVSHKEAMKGAARLKYDLKFEGVVIAYSWSSRGDLFGYFRDEKTVMETVEDLQDFLLMIVTKLNAEKVHVLAHSMGNRALIEALKNLYQQYNDRPELYCAFSQLIFAAADERRSKFEELSRCMDTAFQFEASSKIRRDSEHGNMVGNAGRKKRKDIEDSAFSTKIIFRPRLTVYCATDDKALYASGFIHWDNRLGDTRSLFKSKSEGDEENNDVVDASGFEGDAFRHSYYGDVPRVINDIGTLLRESKAAKLRVEHVHPIKHQRKSFYAFNANAWQTKGGPIKRQRTSVYKFNANAWQTKGGI